MNRFKNILAVYNDAVGDDGALAQATAMAKMPLRSETPPK